MATSAASRLVVDTGSAAQVVGGTLTLRATLLAADGTEVKSASFAWTSSDPAVAAVLSAADKAPAASVLGTAPVGIYATIRMLAAGSADITATATLPDGSRVTSVTHLTVQAAPARTYSLAASPSTVIVNRGSPPQTVTAVVQRSDGADGLADLTNWSWTSDNAAFVVAPDATAAMAQVTAPTLAGDTLGATGQLTVCADAPAHGGRLCANAALSRPAVPLPVVTFSSPALMVKPGRSSAVTATLTDVAGAALAGLATLSWSLQQTGTAAAVVGGTSGATITIASSALQVAPYAATLTLTANYPDGRSSSTSLPLQSPGPWHRLPDAPIPTPLSTSLAIDDTRVWRLTSNGNQPARLERFGEAPGATAREPASPLQASSSQIWLAAAADPSRSSVVVQNGLDGASVAFTEYVADSLAPANTFLLSGCADPAVNWPNFPFPVTGGRNFVKASDGLTIHSAGWCAEQLLTWKQTVGSAVYIPFGIIPADRVNVLEVRPWPTGGVSIVLSNGGGGYQYAPGGGVLSWGNVASLSQVAIPSDVQDETSPVYGYQNGSLSMQPSIASAFMPLVSSPVVTKLRADRVFVVGLTASALHVVRRSGGDFIVPLPTSKTGVDFESASGQQGRLRAVVRLSDNSMWVYDQP